MMIARTMMFPKIKLVEGRYPPIITQFSESDLRRIADVKRFVERYAADGKFRRKLVADPRGTAAEYGLRADPEALRSVWDSAAGSGDGSLSLDSHVQELVGRYDRELVGWMMRRRHERFVAHPQFRAWWRRQVARGDSEFGVVHNHKTAHAPACFELSKGCSVGCWFCGISAEKFEGPFPYTAANARLWRETLEVMRDVAGPAAESSFCYWATDPFDNPDYESYVGDFHGVMGVLPATTTAVPHKDFARTRRFLGIVAEYGFTWNRFSIVAPSVLDRVHAEFTPEELIWTGMEPLTRESVARKTVAGRARDRLRKEGKLEAVDHGEELRATSIACVTGFLFNMVEKRVKLISPCRASDRWPLGYRIYHEGTFADGSELRALIEKMIAEHMPVSLAAGDTVRFRPDLRYEQTADGFALATDYARHAITHSRFGKLLGEVLRRGPRSLAQVRAECGSVGLPESFVNDAVQSLFDAGTIDDEPAYPAADLQPVRVEFGGRA